MMVNGTNCEEPTADTIGHSPNMAPTDTFAMSTDMKPDHGQTCDPSCWMSYPTARPAVRLTDVTGLSTRATTARLSQPPRMRSMQRRIEQLDGTPSTRKPASRTCVYRTRAEWLPSPVLTLTKTTCIITLWSGIARRKVEYRL